jgi:hypothetical protein
MQVCLFVATSVAKGCPNFAIEFPAPAFTPATYLPVQQQEKEASLKSGCGGSLFGGSKPLTAQKEVQLQENETSDHANPG